MHKPSCSEYKWDMDETFCTTLHKSGDQHRKIMQHLKVKLSHSGLKLKLLHSGLKRVCGCRNHRATFLFKKFDIYRWRHDYVLSPPCFSVLQVMKSWAGPGTNPTFGIHGMSWKLQMSNSDSYHIVGPFVSGGDFWSRTSLKWRTASCSLSRHWLRLDSVIHSEASVLLRKDINIYDHVRKFVYFCYCCWQREEDLSDLIMKVIQQGLEGLVLKDTKVRCTHIIKGKICFTVTERIDVCNICTQFLVIVSTAVSMLNLFYSATSSHVQCTCIYALAQGPPPPPPPPLPNAPHPSPMLPTPPQCSSTPPQCSSTPPQCSSTPPQCSSTPPQCSSTPPQCSPPPPQCSPTPPQCSSTPPQCSPPKISIYIVSSILSTECVWTRQEALAEGEERLLAGRSDGRHSWPGGAGSLLWHWKQGYVTLCHTYTQDC